jgi:hypothetical protein
VDENKRWVALLHDPGFVGTYNAGQSGANTVDEYHTFLYLTREKNVRFDVVVLMTALNDYAWEVRLKTDGGRLRIETYHESLRATLAREHEKSRDVMNRLSEWSCLAYSVEQAKERFWPTESGPGKNIARVYTARRDTPENADPERRFTYSRDEHFAESLHRYAEDAAHNLEMFRREVTATGAKLLVMSEATCWGASSPSFCVELRFPPQAYADGRVASGEFCEAYSRINATYLEAARKAGAFTHDLAREIGPLVNGEEGGRYMYDCMHYTPEGCREVARLLRPVIRRILEPS